MTIHNDAADSIRRLARQYEQMVVAAELLDKFGSLENATAEAVKARDAAMRKLDALNADIVVAEASVTEAKQAAQATEDGASASARLIIADASKEAGDIRRKASDDAGAITAKAKADAAATIAGAKEMAAQFRSEADIVYAETIRLQAEVAEKQAELDKINAAIEAARGKVAAMLG